MCTDGFSPDFIDEDPGTFHARTFDGIERALWVPRLRGRKTLVLGSSQRADTIDADALEQADVSLASRRSGGGAVLVSHDDLVWFDVIVGANDPRWDPDVGRSFDWIGDACQKALSSLGVDTTLHDGPLQRTKWSRRICFAGLGPGELTLDGKKLVGMSQRRTRTASRIQVAILRRWNGAEHASFLSLPADEQARAAEDLEHVATGIPHSQEEILKAIFQQLT